MPEAPELIYFKEYIQSTSLHQKVKSAEVYNKNVLSNCSEKELRKALLGRSFKFCSNYGKYLFLSTDSQYLLVMHFGMTGEPVYFKNEEQRPGYSRAEFKFENGYTLSYNCLRMLGGLDLIKQKEEYIISKGLGPDITSEDFDSNTFSKLLDGRRGYIKSALMDQKLMAGIGNECSDEILFQAGVHPKKKVSDLSDQQVQRIYDQIDYVIKSVKKTLSSDRKLPDSFILKNRSEGANCPNCSGKLCKIEIGSRNGYFCPNCQTLQK